jgi:hypothetical protein|uniref:Uncharacterized protein n=1 Tax=viral metagenome TaxID=1070528 RepID=A0A6C0CB91_9ZZZZ
MATFKFWQFGCWNNLNTIDGVVQGRANDVMTFIKKKLDELDPPDKLIISGDNYYPHKIEDKKKDKSPKEETSKKKDKSPKGEQSEKKDKSPKDETSKKLEKAPSTTKEKTIYTEVLKAGLLSLPVDIPITMILGNHDLDRNDKKNLFVTSPSDLQSRRPEKNECEIIQLELKAIKEKKNIDYVFFKSEFINNETLLLMIDTSIYELEKDTTTYLPCYNTFFENNPFYKDIKLRFLSIKYLRRYQYVKIQQAINKAQRGITTIKHVIIVGHHPIFQIKYKKTEVVPIKFTSDIHLGFKPVLKKIYNKLPKALFYYLCSDLHLYQEGLITLKLANDKTMTINQYIVGTGGTKLDPNLPEPEKMEKTHTAENIRYTFKREIQDHGYLECIITEGSDPTFEFIPISVPDPVSGGRKYNSTKRIRKRMRKRKTKKYTKKHIKKYIKIKTKRKTKKYIKY